MTATLTVKEKVHIVKLYYKLGENSGNVQRDLYEGVKTGKFDPKLGITNKRNNLPSLQNIRHVISVFNETGWQYVIEE